METKLITIAGSSGLSAYDEAVLAKHDLRILQQAAEIQADAQRVRAAQAEAQAQIKALTQITKNK